ncbi:MAG TPA: hypothetical protein VHL57_08560, partial [Flavobacteriales bacterium]|nr:hypothetical protein [Flavobacteriales bacterium]
MNNFSLGTSSMGGGIFQMPVPLGATIRSATLYGIEVAGTGTPTIVQMNNVDLVFGPTTTMTSFSYQTLYGPAVLHALDVTAQIDPTVTTYVLVVPPSEISHNRLVDLSLMIAYELPSEPLVWVDLFWCDHNSAAQEQYTVTTSAPMRTANSVAFATMASYCNVGMHDCEDLRVNGTLLGTFGGDDFNAASTFGTSASLKYSGVEFIGLGDDNADLAINGPDVLTDISSLLVDQATTFQVRYDHCPSISLEDNLMNLMLVAYTSDLCAQAIDLGPDTVLCAGET